MRLSLQTDGRTTQELGTLNVNAVAGPVPTVAVAVMGTCCWLVKAKTTRARVDDKKYTRDA